MLLLRVWCTNLLQELFAKDTLYRYSLTGQLQIRLKYHTPV